MRKISMIITTSAFRTGYSWKQLCVCVANVKNGQSYWGKMQQDDKSGIQRCPWNALNVTRNLKRHGFPRWEKKAFFTKSTGHLCLEWGRSEEADIKQYNKLNGYLRLPTATASSCNVYQLLVAKPCTQDKRKDSRCSRRKHDSNCSWTDWRD